MTPASRHACLTTACILLATSTCGPPPGSRDPSDAGTRFEAVAPHEVTFPENLDIALDIPDDPGELPVASVLWKAPRADALTLAGHLLVRVDDRVGEVVAVDVRDGTETWRAGVPECPLCVFRLSPLFDGERVLVSAGNRVIALDVLDGTRQWTLGLDGLPDGRVEVPGSGIAVFRSLERRGAEGCHDVTTRIHFVDLATGTQLWRLEYVGLFASFAISGAYLHLFLSEACDPIPEAEGVAEMRVIRLADRETVFEGDVPEPYSPPLALPGGVALETLGGIVVFGPGTGDVVWKKKTPPVQTMLLREDALFVASRSAVANLDPATGETRFVKDLGELRFSQGLNVLPTMDASGDVVVLPTDPDPLRGYLLVMDRETGQVRRLFLGYGPASQALVWGAITVLALEDEVVALDLLGEGIPERDLIPVPAAVARLVRDMEEELPFVPWEAAAEEVARMGVSGVDALVEEATDGGSIVAAVLAAIVLQERPVSGAVPHLVSWLDWDIDASEEVLLDPVLGRLLWEVIRALGCSGAESGVGPLGSVLLRQDIEPALRTAAWASLGHLAAEGVPGALATLDTYRAKRLGTTDDGWFPCPLPASRFSLDGPFLSAGTSCTVDEETSFSPTASRASAGGEWLAYTSPALGGRSDVWLLHMSDKGVEGPWFTGITVPGKIDLQYLEEIDDGTVVLEYVERECEDCYLEPEDRPESGKAVEVSVDIASLARDSDGDGWSDLVEERLGTNADREDTDDDGMDDPRDPAPMTSSKLAPQPGDPEAMLVESLFALVGFGDSAEPLYLVSDATVDAPWEGYPAVILGLDTDGMRDKSKELGLPGPPYARFVCPWNDDGKAHESCADPESADPLDRIATSPDGTGASVGIHLLRRPGEGAVYRLEAEIVDGVWIVTGFDIAAAF